MQLQAHQLPDLVITDHEFCLPLDHDAPDSGQITVFAREVVAPGKQHDDLPWLVFFQGGPGNESPRPTTRSGWLKTALGKYRVLLLDQRGTGLSSPVTHQTLARFDGPQAQAGYLKHFRADSIVRDVEQIRRELVGEGRQWSVLGQSFGGFCVTHYLSAAPEGLREAVITGGLPPLERPAEDVYRATCKRVLAKNKSYYERYPGDLQLARDIVDHLGRHEVRLPTGDRLTPKRFQQLGLFFGMSDGFERTHYLLETAFVPSPSGRPSGAELSYKFLRDFESNFSFQTNPLFAILHEAIYCQEAASNWAAERVRAEYPEFEIKPGEPIFFTGEMIYPWMFEELRWLRPLREAAEVLAAYDGWPRLYSVEALQHNTVPCAAAVYYDDMYVERAFSEETAQSIRGSKLWITNEFEHNGLRADGKAVLGRLLGMLHGQP